MQVSYGSICCTYHQLLKYSSPNKTRATKKSLPFGKNPDVYGNRGQENGPKAKKVQTQTTTGIDRRPREKIIIEKWD